MTEAVRFILNGRELVVGPDGSIRQADVAANLEPDLLGRRPVFDIATARAVGWART